MPSLCSRMAWRCSLVCIGFLKTPSTSKWSGVRRISSLTTQMICCSNGKQKHPRCRLNRRLCMGVSAQPITLCMLHIAVGLPSDISSFDDIIALTPWTEAEAPLVQPLVNTSSSAPWQSLWTTPVPLHRCFFPTYRFNWCLYCSFTWSPC